MKKLSIILIIIALFPFLSYAQDTKPLITLSTTTVSPGNDDDGDPIEELNITLHLGAAKSTPIRIDWGDGNLIDYTIGSSEPVSVSETVDLGAKIKIYGDISFVDASQTYLVAVELGQATTLNVLRLSQNKITSIDLSKAPNLKELMITDNKISELNIGVCPHLQELYCGYNNLNNLTLSNNKEISVLNCNNNKITQLDLTMLKDLEIFVPSDNTLNSPLDLSANTKLRTLDIANCGLKELKLNTEYLRRFVAVGNKLAKIEVSPKGKAKYLYHIDIRKNELDACAINDILVFLCDKPIDSDNIAGGYIIKLDGNKGSTQYDYDLVKTASGWKVDAKGNGTGCSTAKIFDNSDTQNGTATILADNVQVAFGTPINKDKEVTIRLIPNAGYVAESVKFEDTPLTADAKDKNNYKITLKISGFISYTFGVNTGSDNTFNSEIIIRRHENTFDISGLQANKKYIVCNALGQIVETGTTSHDGNITFTLNTSGCYFLNVGNGTLKIILP